MARAGDVGAEKRVSPVVIETVTTRDHIRRRIGFCKQCVETRETLRALEFAAVASERSGNRHAICDAAGQRDLGDEAVRAFRKRRQQQQRRRRISALQSREDRVDAFAQECVVLRPEIEIAMPVTPMMIGSLS